MNAPAGFQPQDPQFEARTRGSFARQKAMATIGATLAQIGPGLCEIELPFQVVKPGRTLTVARAEVYSRDGLHVASMQQTLMMLPGTPDTAE